MWLSGPPEGPPSLTAGSEDKAAGLEWLARRRQPQSLPIPTTLTSKGNTSTEVLKSLSSGCSMFPLRKKNLQAPSRPVSRDKKVRYCPGTLPRSSREAMPRLDEMGCQVLGDTGHHFGQYMGCARQPGPYPETVVMVVTEYLEIALPALVLTR